MIQSFGDFDKISLFYIRNLLINKNDMKSIPIRIGSKTNDKVYSNLKNLT